MAGTARTRSALDTLFDDNVNGDIGAQDLKDFLWSTIVLVQSTETVTTSDVTGAVNTHHLCDISGITVASKNLTLPASATAGDRIIVTITTGDDDYELIIKGAATVTINGGSAATEWSRLFIDGETVTFEATSATNWQVVNDGRIPMKARAEDTTGQTFTNSTLETIEAETEDYDIGDIYDDTGFDFTARRTCRFIINSQVRFPGVVDQKTIFTNIRLDPDGTPSNYAAIATAQTSVATTAAVYTNAAIVVPFSAGDVFDIQAQQTSGGDITTDTAQNVRSWVSVVEVLS